MDQTFNIDFNLHRPELPIGHSRVASTILRPQESGRFQRRPWSWGWFNAHAQSTSAVVVVAGAVVVVAGAVVVATTTIMYVVEPAQGPSAGTCLHRMHPAPSTWEKCVQPPPGESLHSTAHSATDITPQLPAFPLAQGALIPPGEYWHFLPSRAATRSYVGSPPTGAVVVACAAVVVADPSSTHFLVALAHAQSPLQYPGLFGVHALQSVARWPPQLTSEAAAVVAVALVVSAAAVVGICSCVQLYTNL